MTHNTGHRERRILAHLEGKGGEATVRQVAKTMALPQDFILRIVEASPRIEIGPAPEAAKRHGRRPQGGRMLVLAGGGA